MSLKALANTFLESQKVCSGDSIGEHGGLHKGQ